jgi:hypothetical protein
LPANAPPVAPIGRGVGPGGHHLSPGTPLTRAAAAEGRQTTAAPVHGGRGRQDPHRPNGRPARARSHPGPCRTPDGGRPGSDGEFLADDLLVGRADRPVELHDLPPAGTAGQHRGDPDAGGRPAGKGDIGLCACNARSTSPGLSHHSAASVPTTSTPGSAATASVNANPIRGVPNVSTSDDKTSRTSSDCSIAASPSSQPGGAPAAARPAASHCCTNWVPPAAPGHQRPWLATVSAPSVSSGRSSRYQPSAARPSRCSPAAGDRSRSPSVTQDADTPISEPDRRLGALTSVVGSLGVQTQIGQFWVCRSGCEATVRSERGRRSAISLLVRPPLARITIWRCWAGRSARAPAAVGARAVVTPQARSSAPARRVQGAAPRRRDVSSAASGEELGYQRFFWPPREAIGETRVRAERDTRRS